MPETNRNTHATEYFTIRIKPGACPRTTFGYRVVPSSATIVVCGTTYVASLDKPFGERNWIAATKTDCAMECEGRTQMAAAIALAESILLVHHGIESVARPAMIINLATRNANPDEEREYCDVPGDEGGDFN